MDVCVCVCTHIRAGAAVPKKNIQLGIEGIKKKKKIRTVGR